MLRDGPNPALQKFMERKAPRAHDAVVKMKVHIPEEQSLINYPKDISGTILMCGSLPPATSLPWIARRRARTRVGAAAADHWSFGLPAISQEKHVDAHGC